ncbi:NgoFVII family restriction endonuclease [Vibrio sp. SCSIO 43140]|uniref:phospholipase D-like domain-containing protein n=1 Tax=Vibrio sp. SCSIO 43140 TaxID=2819100 RepID=UPI002076035E|nr:phospholipase D-like domain-containing protein [Vibrio sp. SCSIO 43140]USD59488.1 NgoFVII family restriction endonuclease [Vibrio sp. SCSIO 43140]
MSYNQLFSGEELAKKMSALLRETEQIRIVSAYVTSPAIKWLNDNVQHSNVKIIGRFAPRDFLSGASNVQAIEMAIQHGYEVFMLENLHAKVYELDRTTIFSGSANLTSKGFGLCSTPNSEVAVELPCTPQNQAFIDKFFRDSLVIDSDLIKRMNKILDEHLIESNEGEDIPDWEFDVKYTELFVVDLPLSPPYETCESYETNPDSDFALVYKAMTLSPSSGSAAFKRSKCYKWLYNVVFSEFRGEVRFGELAKLLHNAIADDPSPYRKQVKDIQVNLLLFLELFASDTFEIVKPGARSQVIRLKDV